MKLNHVALQSVAAGLAVFVSASAAVFAWQQVEVSRKHNRLSVTPILQLTPYLEGPSGRNGIYLSNDGLGPALMKSFSVASDGVRASGFTSDRWSEIVATTMANPACFATGWPKGETALKAGVEIPLLKITSAKNAEGCSVELVKLIAGKRIDVEIAYESIYGEKKQLVANTRVFSRSLDEAYQKLVQRQ